MSGSGEPRCSVYQYLLSGGKEAFLLGKRDWVILVGGGILVIWWGLALGQIGLMGGNPSLYGGHASPLVVRLTAGLLILGGGVTTAVLAARWLGRTAGLWAGWIDALLSSLLVGEVSGQEAGLWGGVALALYGLVGRWAVGSFALANLHGINPPLQGDVIRWVFWVALAGCGLLGGWLGGVLPLAICLLVLARLEDARGLRFFIFPAGWLVVGGMLAGVALLRGLGLGEGTGCIAPGLSSGDQQAFAGEVLGGFAGQGLWLLGALLVMAGLAGAWFSIRQGEIGSPGGTLFGAWALVAGLAVLLEMMLQKHMFGSLPASGGIPEPLALLIGIFLPAWAAAAAVGWTRLQSWLRRVSV